MQGGYNTSPTLFFLFKLSTLKKNQCRSLMQLIKWLNYCCNISLFLISPIHACACLFIVAHHLTFQQRRDNGKKIHQSKLDNFLGLYFDHMHGFWGFISILTEQEMGHFCEPSRCVDSYGMLFIPRNLHIQYFLFW